MSEKLLGSKSIRNLPVFDKSPFEDVLSDVKPKLKRKRLYDDGSIEKQLVVNHRSGEYVGSAEFYNKYKVDSDKFVKLYLSNLSIMFGLSNSALRVFLYITTVVEVNKDVFTFDLSDCMTFTQYKKEKSVYEGLYDLGMANIIGRSNRYNKWYINSRIVFNGDRLVVANEFIRDRSKDKAISVNSAF